MSIYFTSDTHFGHTNIIKYCNRPFSSVEEMDATLIANWNKVVQPTDTVYHLGDVAWYRDPDKLVKLMKRLNGKKILIVGNHDKDVLEVHAKHPEIFQDIYRLLDITLQTKTGKQPVTLCHYAMRVWNRSHHGAWQLYGHSHGTLPESETLLATDVGVDSWGFTPVSVQQLEQVMRAKTFNPVDHHGKTD